MTPDQIAQVRAALTDGVLYLAMDTCLMWERGLHVPCRSPKTLVDMRDTLLAALPVEAEPPGITLRQLQETNVIRANRWHGLDSWSPLEWAGAMAGEAGEACNAAKKLKRIDENIANINHEPGRSLTDRDEACAKIGREVADTIIYGVLLAARVGVDIQKVVAEVFNAKSEEYGFPERLVQQPAVAAEPPTCAQWQPIATAPRGVKCAFWIVPKTADETWTDTQGRPITAKHEPYLHIGRFGEWGALSKATHWQPVYDYGRPTPPTEDR